jgi:glucoamylase
MVRAAPVPTITRHIVLIFHRYLTTLAAAELLYDAIYQWDQQGSLTIDDVSLPFFSDLVGSNATSGSFTKGSAQYSSLTSAVRTYADGFIGIVQEYTPSDGSLAEQFTRDSGEPSSATLLTWSFASFLTTVSRRNGEVPSSWGSSKVNTVPSQCNGDTVIGTYVTPTLGSW